MQNIQSRNKLYNKECLLMGKFAIQPNFLFRTVTDGLCEGLVFYYPVMCGYVCGGERVRGECCQCPCKERL